MINSSEPIATIPPTFQDERNEILKSNNFLRDISKNGRLPNELSSPSFKYSGDSKGKVAHGTGKLKIGEHSTYQGNFYKGRYHGYGEMTVSEGALYRGQFEGGVPRGQGVLEKKGDYEYRGEFGDNGLFSGSGVLDFGNGEYYEGGFKNGKFEGSGKYVWPGKMTFEGIYQNGLKHGEGILKREGSCFLVKGIWDKGNLVKYELVQDIMHSMTLPFHP